MLSSFHFLRPWWFIAIIPALILFWFMLKDTRSNRNNWVKHCDPHLLKYLLVDSTEASSIVFPLVLLSSWLIAVFALAGPTWSFYAQKVYQKNIARVIVLDVSQSMNATDIKPSRMERAKYKVLDLLHEIKEGQTGMVVFSSKAFTVSPLTSDSNTIASMVPVLDSNIVPVQGAASISDGLNQAAKLLSQAGYTQGQIILLTDSMPSEADFNKVSKLTSDGYVTSVLAVGNNVVNSMGTNDDGSQSSFDTKGLEKLAHDGHGDYVLFSDDNSDTEKLVNVTNLNQLNNQPSKELETKSLWKDEGLWFVWLVMFIVAFMAKKGWLEKIC